MNFTLSAFDLDCPNKSEVTHRFNATELGDVVEFMDLFLKGCGYHYDGQLTICPDEYDSEDRHEDEVEDEFGDGPADQYDYWKDKTEPVGEWVQRVSNTILNDVDKPLPVIDWKRYNELHEWGV